MYSLVFPLVLQLFLSSPRPTLRFAAVRTLNKVAMTQPMSVTTCNLDLENLITDVNRSIATLAITTLLKVCLLDLIINLGIIKNLTATSNIGGAISMHYYFGTNLKENVSLVCLLF